MLRSWCRTLPSTPDASPGPVLQSLRTRKGTTILTSITIEKLQMICAFYTWKHVGYAIFCLGFFCSAWVYEMCILLLKIVFFFLFHCCIVVYYIKILYNIYFLFCYWGWLFPIFRYCELCLMNIFVHGLCCIWIAWS